ncbi:MAG: DNA polymerase III subunit gamma/tau, partial [Ramlibacter sp.]|nr:DNA polymerase III subunit gamma/tau [Ramlibacter sp.]
RFKVFMIDEVHMLTGHAFNAMLKTLEEPPEYLKFVLATTDPQKVPVTVLSRCLQFNLRPMAPETVQEHLLRVLQAEGVEAQAPALRLLARAARGSMRDALSLTDQAIAYGGGKIEEAAVRQMLGSVDRGHVFRLLDALAAGDARSVVETSDALRTLGLSAASTLEEMSAVLQRMAVIQAVPSAADHGDSETAEIARLAALMPADEVQLLYSICLQGRAELGLAPDEYAGLTMVLLRLLAFKPAAGARPAQPTEKKTPDEAGAAGFEPNRGQPASTTTRPAPAAAPLQAPAPSRTRVPAGDAPPGRVLRVVESPPLTTARREGPEAPNGRPAGEVLGVPVRVQAESARESGAASPAWVPTQEGDFWHATVADLVAREAVTAMVRELALQSQLVGRDEGHWMLRVERESLNQPTSRERLQNALAAAGQRVSLSVEVGPVSDSPARRIAAAAAAKQRAAEDIIHADPFVQAMVREFGARIVPGSIKPLSTHELGDRPSRPSPSE